MDKLVTGIKVENSEFILESIMVELNQNKKSNPPD